MRAERCPNGPGLGSQPERSSPLEASIILRPCPRLSRDWPPETRGRGASKASVREHQVAQGARYIEKGYSHLLGAPEVRYRTMRSHAAEFRVEWMAKALDVSTGGYYAWFKRPESRRAKENRRLAVEIKAIHEASRKTYGSPRIHSELTARGISCSRGRVAG